MIKIQPTYLQKIKSENNINKYFGNWIQNIEDYSKMYQNAKPFSYVTIPNFLNTEIIESVSQNYPTNFNNWYQYKNPLEVKYAFDNIEELPTPLKNIFYVLSTPRVMKLMEKITGINNLEYDPYLHGAGIHAHPRGGKLAIHLDYEKHPILKNKERRLNIILYLSKNWKPEWNGHTELWNSNVTECVSQSPVVFNTALIFKTNNISWHGLPEEIQCPPNVFRKSLAYYYITDLVSKPNLNNQKNQEAGYRKKANYTLRPQDEKNEKILKLIDIRNRRRLNSQDLL